MLAALHVSKILTLIHNWVNSVLCEQFKMQSGNQKLLIEEGQTIQWGNQKQ
jgi:hypothetical protein